MQLARALLALLSAVAIAHAAQQPDRNATRDATPKRYIVELSSRAKSSRAASLRRNGLRIVKHFDSDLFPAVSVECIGKEECGGADIAKAIDEEDDEDGVAVAAVYKAQTLRIISPYAEGESFSNDAAAANYSMHSATGVEKLHEMGIIGEGATVALIDTGVQYTHPALGGGIGPEYTVIGGYDLIGDGDVPTTPPQPDDDPMDYYGHGTHVAGIVAGKSEQFVGVAPGAKIRSYKVISNTGYSNEEIVIEGFLMAYEEGADIISASLGEKSGFTSNALAVVASRMVEQGVFVCIAIGNDGQDGPFMSSNGASGVNVLTVASSEPGTYPAQAFSATFTLNGTANETEVAYIPGFNAFPTSIADWPIVPVSKNSSVKANACNPLPDDTPDLSTRVVLIRSGGCSVYNKLDNVAAFNASYVLIYSDDGPYVPPPSGASPLTGAIEDRAGEAIVATVAAGGKVSASFDITTGHYVGLHNAGPGRPALYSSFGGTYDLFLKPDIAAPGSKILSTYPTDSYQVLSGTSMATPYMAGIAALWVGVHGGRAANGASWAKTLIARMVTTGRTVPWADYQTSATDYGFWAPTTQVGGGFVDAIRIMNYTTQTSFEGRKFELNDTAHFVGTHSVEITNTGSESVTYNFTLQDAGGYEAYKPAVPGQSQFGVPAITQYYELVPKEMTPGIVMPEGEFIVGPGESKTAEFTFTVPEGLNETNLPCYSGKILLSGSNGEELGIPYFGVGSNLHDTMPSVWDTGSGFPYLFKGYDGSEGASLEPNVPFNISFNFTRAEQSFPHLNTLLVYGTEELRWDIFDASYTEADWSYPPTVGVNKYIGSATSWNGTASSGWFTLEDNNPEDIFPFPLYDQPRNKWGVYFWLGRLANGSEIVPGEYKWRIAALKPFGDRERASDWDVWETPKITVLPKGGKGNAGGNGTTAARR
ncbi:putative minor extracellular protease vpr [Bimuria novae-zelandiae CBS 107.79]|uniref:Putative minor extracellular protease vpr n=1 Tax=Bimuria novae-zelandiae CBS 107.79 TaxID=1447943 RepID=A0A6A5UQ08_9PLEO|nr:putative minor extracellular protease vpr [Bimuria novae-zelandiae CBS 107.79]